MSKKMLGDLMKQAQKMQQEMGKIQEESKKKTVEASAGGGMVVAVANGAMEVISIKIEKDVVNPEDIDMLQDLVVAAVNEALRLAQQMVSDDMGKVMGGMNIPGMGNMFG
jgi:DNA-binding YbaB/EbfC family protein